MSLRSFHLLFIVVVVAVLCGLGWILGRVEALEPADQALYSRLAYGSALILGPYLAFFFWKTRGLAHSSATEFPGK